MNGDVIEGLRSDALRTEPLRSYSRNSSWGDSHPRSGSFDGSHGDVVGPDEPSLAVGACRPSREQFVVGPYLVQHQPTGAKFGAYPGERDVCYINWGRLSERCAAQDYRDELRRIACELLRERAKF